MRALTLKTKILTGLVTVGLLGLLFWWWIAYCGECEISFNVPQGPWTDTWEMCHPTNPGTAAALLDYCGQKYPCGLRRCTDPAKQCIATRWGEAPGNITVNCTHIGACPSPDGEGLPLEKYQCTVTVPAGENLNCGCTCS